MEGDRETYNSFDVVLIVPDGINLHLRVDEGTYAVFGDDLQSIK